MIFSEGNTWRRFMSFKNSNNMTLAMKSSNKYSMVSIKRVNKQRELLNEKKITDNLSRLFPNFIAPFSENRDKTVVRNMFSYGKVFEVGVNPFLMYEIDLL